MADAPEPESYEMARTVAVARLLLGGQMNVQAPPNLSPHDHRLLLRSGINDWGGISPVSIDYVNPEAAWPHLNLLAKTCTEAGFTLRERLAIYEEYIDRPGFPPTGPTAAYPRVTSRSDGLISHPRAKEKPKSSSVRRPSRGNP